MNELLQQFNSAGVRYLVMGGQAMRLTGMPRATMDWDFFIPPRDQKNFDLLNKLLEEHLDLTLLPLGERGENFVQTYQTVHGVIQFHLGVPGVPKFDEAEKHAAVRTLEDGLRVKCLSGSQLLGAKLAANRPKDQDDIKFLLELQKLGKL